MKPKIYLILIASFLILGILSIFSFDVSVIMVVFFLPVTLAVCLFTKQSLKKSLLLISVIIIFDFLVMLGLTLRVTPNTLVALGFAAIYTLILAIFQAVFWILGRILTFRNHKIISYVILGIFCAASVLSVFTDIFEFATVFWYLFPYTAISLNILISIGLFILTVHVAKQKYMMDINPSWKPKEIIILVLWESLVFDITSFVSILAVLITDSSCDYYFEPFSALLLFTLPFAILRISTVFISYKISEKHYKKLQS